jgi:CHAD domain
MRARDVHELECGATFAETARAVLAARLDEVAQIRTAITGAGQSEDLHDLRIAAKRLRYSLETFEACFPSKAAHTWANRVRDLQDVLGRIHDLDVLMALLTDRLRDLDDRERKRVIALLRSSMDGPERELLLHAALYDDLQRETRAGLYRVVGLKLDERKRRYEDFTELWSTWEREDVFGQIHGMISGQEADASSQ